MRSVKVRVHEKGIQSLFVPGGGVNNFGQRVAFTTTNNMRQFATKRMRTGTLLRSFRTSSQVRRNKVAFNVTSSAPHAIFLHSGTRPQGGGRTLYAGVPPVGLRSRYAPRSRASAFPRWQQYIGVRVNGVSGIKPTYFMSRALNQSLRRHRLA